MAVKLEKQELTPELKKWAFDLCNHPDIYQDGVEQIVEVAYGPKLTVVIAIDEGNPPIVPLKQLAFRFKTSDEEREELIGFEIRLLNPDEVEGGDSRPAQFAALVPTNLWDLLASEEFWADACGDGDCCDTD